VRRGLRAEGVIVDLAASGKEVVWVAAERHYDAVVLDVMLPGIDGFETCARLRREEVWAPVLMLTARDGVERREEKALPTPEQTSARVRCAQAAAQAADE
jgi:two-component system OmpR family response regulator